MDGGVSDSPEPMAFRNRIMCRHKSHLPCSRAVLNRRVACCLLTAGTSIFYKTTKEDKHSFYTANDLGRYEQFFYLHSSLNPENKCCCNTVGDSLIANLKGALKNTIQEKMRQLLCWCNINYDLLNSHYMPNTYVNLTFFHFS